MNSNKEIQRRGKEGRKSNRKRRGSKSDIECFEDVKREDKVNISIK